MKINAVKKSNIEVEIDDIEIARIVLSKYCEIFNINEDSNIFIDEDDGIYALNRVDELETRIHEVTETEKKALDIFKILKQRL